MLLKLLWKPCYYSFPLLIFNHNGIKNKHLFIITQNWYTNTKI